MTLRAIVHQEGDGGFWAEVPALPGCATQGDTMDEIETNLREAIEGWLAVADGAAVADANAQVMEIAV